MNNRRASTAVRFAALGLAIVGLSSCSGPASFTGTKSAVPTSAPTSAPPTAAPPTATALATAIATAPPATSSSALPQVDLIFSGAHEFTAAGSAGSCAPAKDASGNVTEFDFGAEATDYPGLGVGLSVSQPVPGDYVSVKWLATQDDEYLRPDGEPYGGTVTLSADRHSVTLDVDLDHLGTGQAAPEHVSGTIICP